MMSLNHSQLEMTSHFQSLFLSFLCFLHSACFLHAIASLRRSLSFYLSTLPTAAYLPVIAKGVVNSLLVVVYCPQAPLSSFPPLPLNLAISLSKHQK